MMLIFNTILKSPLQHLYLKYTLIYVLFSFYTLTSQTISKDTVHCNDNTPHLFYLVSPDEKEIVLYFFNTIDHIMYTSKVQNDTYNAIALGSAVQLEASIDGEFRVQHNQIKIKSYHCVSKPIKESISLLHILQYTPLWPAPHLIKRRVTPLKFCKKTLLFEGEVQKNSLVLTKQYFAKKFTYKKRFLAKKETINIVFQHFPKATCKLTYNTIKMPILTFNH